MSPALSGPLRVHLPQGSPPGAEMAHSGLLRESERLDCLCFEWFLKRWPCGGGIGRWWRSEQQNQSCQQQRPGRLARVCKNAAIRALAVFLADAGEVADEAVLQLRAGRRVGVERPPSSNAKRKSRIRFKFLGARHDAPYSRIAPVPLLEVSTHRARCRSRAGTRRDAVAFARRPLHFSACS